MEWVEKSHENEKLYVIRHILNKHIKFCGHKRNINHIMRKYFANIRIFIDFGLSKALTKTGPCSIRGVRQCQNVDSRRRAQGGRKYILTFINLLSASVTRTKHTHNPPIYLLRRVTYSRWNPIWMCWNRKPRLQWRAQPKGQWRQLTWWVLKRIEYLSFASNKLMVTNVPVHAINPMMCIHYNGYLN